MPDSVRTLTITASRLTARPMPRRTLLSLGSGNDVGIAVISAILSATSNLGKGESICSPSERIFIPDETIETRHPIVQRARRGVALARVPVIACRAAIARIRCHGLDERTGGAAATRLRIDEEILQVADGFRPHA